MLAQHEAPTGQTRVRIINDNQRQAQIPQHTLTLIPSSPKHNV